MGTHSVRITSCVLGLCLLLSQPVSAQEAGQAEDPGLAALRRIRVIEDPAKQLAAYKQFLIDFPDSPDGVISSVTYYIAKAMVAESPRKDAEIVSYADRSIATSPRDELAVTYLGLASAFEEEGALLEKAEEYARRGIEVWEEDTAKETRAKRAGHWVMLGRIHAKRKNTAGARKAFEQAMAADPDSTDAALELSVIEKAAGNHAVALNHLLPVILAGGATYDLRRDLVDLYSKVHPQKRAEELEKTLDAMYEKKYPNPIKDDRYQPPAGAAAGRVTLAEVFTSASCPPCVAADLAFDAALARYEPTHLVVLMYHVNIPTLDPMSNRSSEARMSYYGVDSSPQYRIDGREGERGGDPSREESPKYYNALKQKIEAGLKTPAAATIKLDAVLQGATVRVKAAVSDFRVESPNLKLQIALVEDRLSFSGESSIRFHPMVVRSLASPAGAAAEAGTGFSLSAAQPKTVEHVFDLQAINRELKQDADGYEKESESKFIQRKDTIADGNSLSVVAFVQDERTKRILQTAYLKVRPAPAMAAR